MKNTILFIVVTLMVASCQKSEKVNKINVANWILGNWESKSDEGTLTESWSKVNDSTFQATSYFTKEKDTIHFETITLQQKGDVLTYYATVIGQNNDKAVAFKQTNETPEQLTFENLKHDYPQKISYSHKTTADLAIKISGIQQGKPTSEEFIMKKIK
ncbi:DUF6265 family protein [Flavobacterium sp. XS1P32]|uniref:DUF6265 family protein n=1 Tax=unclassified Flavobacterium TaxID=196869 RepID=UPI003AB03E9B